MCEKFGINNKVFKVVADGAKNVKSAFQPVTSSEDVQDITSMLIIKQRQLDRQQEQEERAKTVLIIEIDKMNAPIETKSPSRKRTREEIFDEYDLFDERTDEIEPENEELSDTFEGQDFDFEDGEEELAFTHCSCHNLNLVVGKYCKIFII